MAQLEELNTEQKPARGTGKGFVRITTFFDHETLMNQVALLRVALRPRLAWHGSVCSSLCAGLICDSINSRQL